MAFRNGTVHQSYNRLKRAGEHQLMSDGRITQRKAAAILLHVQMDLNGIIPRYSVQSESRMEVG